MILVFQQYEIFSIGILAIDIIVLFIQQSRIILVQAKWQTSNAKITGTFQPRDV